MLPFDKISRESSDPKHRALIEAIIDALQPPQLLAEDFNGMN